MQMVDEKLPPHDIDAEEATIGSLIIDGAAITDVLFLSDTHFYDERNQWLYNAILKLYGRSVKIDIVTLAEELNRQKRLEECGGRPFLSYLASVVPSSMDVVHYANIVQRKAVLRRMIEVGREIERLGFEDYSEPSEALNKADSLLLDIRKGTVGTPIIDPETRRTILRDRYERLYEEEKGVSIKTGISSLDVMLGGGMFAGEVILVAGRTGMGKTSFAQTIANNVGKARQKVLYCSVEMSWQSLSDRDMAGILNMPISEIRMGGYDSDTFSKLTGVGLDELSKLEVYYYDDNPMTTAKIMNAGMEMKLRYGLSLIVVDYLGILGDDFGRSPYERLGYISRNVKQIARVLDVPVLSLHQLSRQLESQVDKRPQLKDLRDSGNLEEDADTVLFLYRENYYSDSTHDSTTELILGKQRQGDNSSRGRVKLHFDLKTKTYKGIYDG